MRGTPHVHSLVCIKHDGLGPLSAESEDPLEFSSFKKLIQKTVSAILIPRHHLDKNELPDHGNDRLLRIQEECMYDWKPHKNYFTDADDPRRDAFDPTLNYNRNADGSFEDPRVQTICRRLQISNQMHDCCFTCFKYCMDENKICRFCFPWPKDVNSSSTDVIVVKDRDKKHRVRLKVVPQRTNANLNPTFQSPLINCAHGGNSDIQYIMNSHGAAEYAAGYASKAEAPDQKRLQAIFIKAITNLQEIGSMVTDRQRLTIAAKAVIGSTQVGSVQAAYFILNQPFVISSREVLNVNPSHGKNDIVLQYYRILNQLNKTIFVSFKRSIRDQQTNTNTTASESGFYRTSNNGWSNIREGSTKSLSRYCITTMEYIRTVSYYIIQLANYLQSG
jgi:hypothetical protein